VNGLFGYITPYKEELKIREYSLFKAYYCSLCKTLGKEFNQIVRMGLNYDFAFLALLLSSIDRDRDAINMEGCIINPVKKKPVVKCNRNIVYSAYMSMLQIYYKLLDDWKDHHSFIALSAMLPYLASMKKAKKVYYDKYMDISNHLKSLSILEKNQCSVIDESADAFAKLMQSLFTAPYINDEKTIRILGWMGYNLGRWIYIIDAFNDIEKDIKQKNYNPILLQYQYSHGEEWTAFIDRIKEPVERSLTFTLDNVSKSFELLDVKYNRTVLENIIYMGLRRKMDQIFVRKGCNSNEKSI